MFLTQMIEMLSCLLQVLVLEQAARIVQESGGISCDVIDLVRQERLCSSSVQALPCLAADVEVSGRQ
jgi:hypothetical protein